MALPHFKEARLFYQAGLQRFEDAQLLFKYHKTTGAVYLAGYGVECFLKALVLSAIANLDARAKMLKSFHGARAHDFEWLKKRYLDHAGASIPPEIARHFAFVNTWSTDMRYKPGSVRDRDAKKFLDAAEKIIEWAKGRL
jgi:HEPN domain-containing protein